MTLRLVPTPETVSPDEKVRQRIKKMVPPDGMLQCKRCGGRTTMTAKTGVAIKNGRKTGGTTVEKDVCLDCYVQGVYCPMMPGLESVK
nr:hypothetical protein [Pseudomonas sp.]